MTAIEHSFSDTLPQRLYVDTNVIFDYLVDSRPHHARAQRFLDNVCASRLTTLYLSSICWLEYAHVVLSRGFRDALPEEEQDLHRLREWGADLVRETYLRAFLGKLDEFLGQFETVEIALTPEVREQSLVCAAQYNLDTQDAVHLASMMLAGVLDLVSFDRDFRHIDGLHLWNDRTYS